MIEITFLGSGAALPGAGNSNACYFVRLGSENLLIDCGPGILQQLDRAGISPREISHVFFTHKHGDHALGFPMLMLWRQINPSGSIQTPVLIGSEVTLDGLEQLLQVAYGDYLSEIWMSAPKMPLPGDGPGSARIHPNIMLRTLPMSHSDFAPVLGVRIETRGERLGERVLAFTGDTGPNENIVPLARDADVLVHEANLCDTIHPRFAGGAFGHSTARIAGQNAALAGVRRLLLTHIDATYDGQHDVLLSEARSAFAGDVSAPQQGARLTV
jgi:ribonuclease BN (tRNA processing enzyme)